MPQFMNALLSRFKIDKIVYYSSISSFLTLLVSFVLVSVFYRLIPPIIPLYNQMPWGQERLVAKSSLFILLALGFCMYIINIILLQYLYNSIPLLSRIISVTTVLGMLFVFFIVARTIFILI